ncbi:DUF5801 repeats-in-toxin domain-containing protein, partial [Qipengyuania sp. 902]|uniref:DUF5801 repeats-in-toxin domain-containing protein n=1 Tax=Qipengyuania sp. 902 TaxID=3417565 RepID=UPI003EC0B4D5
MVDFEGHGQDGFMDRSTDADPADLQQVDAGRSGSVSDVAQSEIKSTEVIRLPAGSAIQELRAEGSDLIVVLDDGSVIRVPDGAIIVPQFVIGDVQIPPQNIAALLTGNEPQPAAGAPQSSGGNFGQNVGDIQDAYALGDLLPYTELSFPERREEEIIPNLAEDDPDIVIVTPDNPVGAVNATDEVNEAGLPARGDEPAGTRAASDAEITNGSIVYTTPDGFASLSINGIEITRVGQTIEGEYGTLTITAIGAGRVEYRYVLNDNTIGVEVDSFAVTVTDLDGDTADASLDIRIVDDAPIARDDAADQASEGAPVTIDVFANDTPGADGVAIGTVALVAGTLSGAGLLVNNGDGTFTYFPAPGEEGTVSFDYTITDGDGDVSRATATLTLVDDTQPDGGDTTATVDDDGLARGNPVSDEGDLDADEGDDPSDVGEATFTGTLEFDVGGDAPANIAFDASLDGSTAIIGTETVTYSISGNVLTATGPRGVLFTVELLDDATGAYRVTLVDNVLHEGGPNAEAVDASTVVSFLVTDSDGDEVTTTLTIVFDDDAPTAYDNVASTDEGGTIGGNVLTDGTDDIAGADGFGGIVALSSENQQTDTVALVDGNLVLVGQYGTLTLNAATGVYTYVAAPNSTNADAVDVFTYTIVDGDGDTATATLTIDVANIEGTVDDTDLTADEAGLATGSNPGSGSETAGGQIVVSDATGPFVYVLTGPADGTYGTLTLDSDTGAYSYTLSAPFSDSDTGENSRNVVNGADSFGYEVYDTAGNLVGSGTIAVNIVDDVPDAVDEAALSIVEGANSGLAGNVLANDVEGADGASVTSVSIGGTDYVVAATGITTVTTDTGVYTFDASGNWTFDPAAGLDQSDGPIDASFTYTLTDGDDDFDRATQPITITDGLGPTAGDPVSLVVDDENLPDGSDPATPVTDSATISFTPGSDAIVAIAFDDTAGALDNLGGGLTWVRISDTQIVGRSCGEDIVTLDLTVDGDNAIVTMTLNDNYAAHPLLGDDLANLGSVLVVATDIDGDRASASVSLGVSDDVPTLGTTSPAIGSLEVDESDLSIDAVAGFAGLFVPSFNADGPGSVSDYVLGITAGSTGLVDTASGEAVVLSLENGAVVGRTEVGGDVVFVLTVDAAGTVTLDQQRAVVHADGSDPDDATGLANAGLITLSATVTDGDGDTATATVAIGNALSFRDDGPSIDASAVDGDTILLTTQDADTIGAAFDTDTTTADFGGAFSVASQAYGADGAGSVSWTYALVIENTASGLISNGAAVTLAFDGSDVVGSANGIEVFRLSVDPATGVVTLTQYEEIDHPLPGANGAPYDDQFAILGTGILSLEGTATIVDRDGDRASETVSLDLGGNIRFADDGPVVEPTGASLGLVVDDSDFAVDAEAEYSDAFAFAFGADGAAAGGGESYALGLGAGASGLTDTLSGAAVVLSLEGGQVVGRAGAGGEIVFVLSVDGDGTVTLDQRRSVVHDNPNADNEPTGLASGDLVTLTATATDGDGDTDSATIAIGGDLVFRDDAPVAGTNDDVQLDDETLGGGIAGGIGDVDPDTANTIGTLAHDFGNDGGSIAFLTGGAPAGFQYVASGSDILVQQWQGGAWVTLVTVTLDAATGAYTVTQNANVLHADGGEENDTSFTLTYRMTDGDNDTADGTLTINVDDDTPTATPGTSLTGSVDEDELPGGIEGGPGDIGVVGLTTGGSVAALFASGADSPLTYAFETAASSTTYLEGLGLTSGGVALSYAVTAGSIVATAGGAPVFTLTLSTAGAWEFTLEGVLDHTVAGTEDDIAIDFGGLVVGTDADGDSVTATGSLTVTVDDDSPTATPGASLTGSVDEDALGGGIEGGPGDIGVVGLTTGGSVAALFASGADSPLSYAFETAASSTAYLEGLGLSSGGVPLSYAVTAGSIVATAGGAPVFTLTLSAAGAWQFTLEGVLDHTVAGTEDDIAIDFGGLVVGTDADGDSVTATGSLTVTVDDDSPVAVADSADVTEGGAIARGSEASVLANDRGGADGIGRVVGVRADGDPADTTSSVTGGLGTAIAGDYGTLMLYADGTYSYTANSDIPDDPASDVFVYTFVDGDGDIATATLTIDVNQVTLVADDRNALVFEAALDLVQDPGDLAPGTVVGSNPSSPSETVGGTLAVTGGVGTITYALDPGQTGAYGQISIDANGNWTYTLTGPVDGDALSPSQGGDNGANVYDNIETFTYTATDENGNTVQGTITIDVTDDVPSVTATGASLGLVVDDSDFAVDAEAEYSDA